MSSTNTFHNAPDVLERLVVTGDLVLTAPTHLGSGDRDSLTDLALRRDEISGQPLLPGTTLAGALRGFLARHTKGKDVALLFGEVWKQESRQSWLFIEDALGTESSVDIRDGVALEPATRTAEDKKKYDLELLAAGTTFPIEIEFWKPASEDGESMTQLLCWAIGALQNGEIFLGARKRRGFGECKLRNLQVYRYHMNNKGDLLRWLKGDRTQPAQENTLTGMIGLSTYRSLPGSERLTLRAGFQIDGSLLIRAYSTAGADMAHLRNAAGEPVLSGTSLAGALRARAGRILALLQPQQTAEQWLNDLFGPWEIGGSQSSWASRLWVKEVPITHGRGDLIQSRVMIDRFTGGSFPTALFNEQAQFGGGLTIELAIEKPKEHEVGLILLLLKDLWTGDLPLGGEASIGRGRLQGQWAEIGWQGKTWKIEADLQQTDQLIISGEQHSLEDAVSALRSPKEVPHG